MITDRPVKPKTPANSTENTTMSLEVRKLSSGRYSMLFQVSIAFDNRAGNSLSLYHIP